MESLFFTVRFKSNCSVGLFPWARSFLTLGSCLLFAKCRDHRTCLSKSGVSDCDRDVRVCTVFKAQATTACGLRFSKSSGCHRCSPTHAMRGQPQASETVTLSGKGNETRDRMSPGWPCAWPCHQSGPATCCSVLEFSPDRSVNPGDIHYWGWPQLVRDPVTPQSSSKNNTRLDILGLIKLACNMLLT